MIQRHGGTYARTTSARRLRTRMNRHRQWLTREMGMLTLLKPTVCLDVISLVASSCGYDSGQIEQRVAHELARHWVTHGGPAERPQHRHPPHAPPVAPVLQHQGRRPRLTPRGFT